MVRTLPTFHDAEVLSIFFDRIAGARVAIYVFERTSEVDAAGFYVRSKHAVVTFVPEGFPSELEGSVHMRIGHFNQQNALAHIASAAMDDTAGYAATALGPGGHSRHEQ